MLTEDSVGFEEVWGEVSRRAVAALRHKGVAAATAEDAVQEAAARAIAGSVPFNDAEDLLRWIHTVAWRVVIDMRKRDHRLVYAVPELASADDTPRAVEARIRVERLNAVVGALTPAEFEALATPDRPGMDRRESVRWAVRRHRARAHLLAMLDGVAGVLAWLRYGIRRRTTRRVAVLVLAPPLVGLCVCLIGPMVRDAPPAVAQSERLATPAVVALPARHAPAVDQAPIRNDGRETTPRAPSPLPRVELDHPTLTGGGTVFGKPKAEEDRFLCTEAVPGGKRCVDLPVRITG